MPRMVILGAGASQACPNNDPNLPMPLLRDLPAVVSHAEPESDWHHFGKTLNGLLQATDGDIEVLLTILYRFNEAFFVPRKQYTLDPGFIDQILASSALPGFFPVPDEANQATSVLRRLRGSIAAWQAARIAHGSVYTSCRFRTDRAGSDQPSIQRPGVLVPGPDRRHDGVAGPLIYIHLPGLQRHASGRCHCSHSSRTYSGLPAPERGGCARRRAACR